MMEFDPDRFGKHVASRVREMIAPLNERIDELEKRLAAVNVPDVSKCAVGVVISKDNRLVITRYDGSVDDAGTVALEQKIIKGERGEKGEPGEKGDTGEKGEPGQDGRDGIGAAGAMINKDGSLCLTTSDGRVHDLGQVVGRDGLGFDDMTAEYDSQTGLNLRFYRGQEYKEKNILPPLMKHCGFWQSGVKVAAGNTITHNGSLWIAKRETEQEPGYKSADWDLAARKGSDK